MDETSTVKVGGFTAAEWKTPPGARAADRTRSSPYEEKGDQMGLKVAQYGVGPTGVKIAALARQKAGLQVIGGIDKDPAKSGKDLGAVAGERVSWNIGVFAGAAEVLARGPDIVLHSTVSKAPAAAAQILECIEADACVITTCEELSYPYDEHPAIARTLDEAAKSKGVAVLATGVNPGFLMDRLPLYLTGVCQSVKSVKVSRVVDASKRRLPLQKKVGAGMTRQEFKDGVARGTIKHYGLPESARMIAHGLGWSPGRVEETIAPVMATMRVKTPYLTVEKGEVAGVRQMCTVTVNGKRVIQLELQMYAGADAPADEIEIRGVPPVRMRIEGGVHGDLATAAVVVNSIPWVMRAPPGLWLSCDLPIRCFSGAWTGKEITG